MRRQWLFLLLSVFSVILFACGDGVQISSAGDDPNQLESIAIVADGRSTAAIALQAGRPVTFWLEGRTASGARVKVRRELIEWSSSNGIFDLEIVDAYSVKISSRTDWFDAPGAEPRSTITMHYDNFIAKAQVRNVIDVSGEWTSVFDDKTTNQLILTQQGRTVILQGLPLIGTVNGDILEFSGDGFELAAKFKSRTHAIGGYTVYGKLTTFVLDKVQ